MFSVKGDLIKNSLYLYLEFKLIKFSFFKRALIDQHVTFHYSVTLVEGWKFIGSSKLKKEPFSFVLGGNEVAQGNYSCITALFFQSKKYSKR